MSRPHELALPYRGDGVAHALGSIYDGPVCPIPADMLALLRAIDRGARHITDPGSTP